MFRDFSEVDEVSAKRSETTKTWSDSSVSWSLSHMNSYTLIININPQVCRCNRCDRFSCLAASFGQAELTQLGEHFLASAQNLAEQSEA